MATSLIPSVIGGSHPSIVPFEAGILDKIDENELLSELNFLKGLDEDMCRCSVCSLNFEEE